MLCSLVSKLLYRLHVPQVLLYLLRLAFGQAQLTWRLVGALALLAT